MSEYIVFDIEANGLLEDSTEIYCISSLNINTKEIKTLNYHIDGTLHLSWITSLFKDKKIIGHNIISYDIPMIKKFYGIDLIKELGKENIIDTYVWSRTSYPDRPVPVGCPASIINPVTRKAKKIGPHSLEALGYTLGYRKVQIHDWTTFTPEVLTRCEGDVEMNEKIYYYLLKEMGLEHGEV